MSLSILASYNRSGHSADVKIHLRIGNEIFSVGQLGPDFLILDRPIDHAPADAVLFLSIDGKERLRAVRLPEGISAASPRVIIAKA
jgi:hypothetical protein